MTLARPGDIFSGPMSYLHEQSNFPGKVNVVAIDACPRVIQSAFVRKNDEMQHAVIELGFYEWTTPEEQGEARSLALIAVLRFLGEEWSGVVQQKKAPSRSQGRGPTRG